MLKLYALVCALLITGSKQQPSLSEVGNSTTPLVKIICDPSQDSYCHDSPSLEEIANEAERFSIIYVNITVSQLQLNATVNFSHLEALIINGDPELSTNIICTKSNTGLVLYTIGNITLTDIRISYCGAIIRIPPNNMYSSAITILHSGDTNVNRVDVIKSKGIGLTILNNHGEFVIIESSHFSENTLPLDDSEYADVSGGGGVYIGSFEQDPSNPVTFRFNSCIVEKNMAHTRSYNHLYTNDLGQPVSGRGLGGGAAILFERALTDIHVIFTGCRFIRNKAFLGAGLASDMGGVANTEMKNISLRVEHSLFEENGCNCSNQTANGGGMHISFHDRSDAFESNKYILHNVTFKNNYAQYGGGLYFFSYPKKHTDHSNIVEIKDCKFEGNEAHIGSAVDITPSVFQRLLGGLFVTPIFRNCTFLNNKVIQNINSNQMQATYGIGTVYVSLYSIVIEGNNTFQSNRGTAIHVVNGNINMSQSDAIFKYNSGIEGGAIALIGVSSMIVGPNRNYAFVNNTALKRGGALFVMTIDNHDFTASKTCFIQYLKNVPAKEWSCTISFIGNKALHGPGNTTFATSLYPCQFINNGTLNESQYETINVNDIFSARGIIIETDKEVISHQIATEGALLQYNNVENNVFPGEEFEHGVSFVDDLENQVEVAFVDATPAQWSEVRPDTTLSSCFGKHIILKGKENVTDKLYLQTVSSRSSVIEFRVILSECPPGFSYDNENLKCICNHKEYVGLVKCDTNRSVAYITPGFWMGLVNDTKDKNVRELVTTYCFLHFCNYNQSCRRGIAIELPQQKNKLKEAMCGESRTGTACGSCATGYTTYFHSPTYQCRRVDTTLCKLGWLFYIVSELVPVTVVFITVIVLDINFTSGAVNGFILFSQLLYSFNIDASGLITFPHWIAILMDGYGLFYGFFSLDFFETEGLSFCLFSNASALDILTFKYITIVYALLLVILVIWFMNKCGGRCLCKWFRITTVKTSIIHGISAFLILCYSQCIRISLNLLDNFSLYVKSGSNMTTCRRVWLNGDVVFFSKDHLPYALPALFCLLTIGILPPALLLAYPLFNKCLAAFGLEESKLVICVSQKIHINSLKPLLDSFQGCFKDNLRFFAGLYFLYRWIAQIISVAPSTGFSRYDVGVNTLLTIILALHALCQPYTRKGHNTIDTLLFTDLILITAITFFHLYAIRARVSKQTAVENITVSAVIQVVLVYLPLLIMTVYVAVSVYRLSCRHKNQSNSCMSISKLSSKCRYLMVPVIGEDSLETEELPHRLITGDVEDGSFATSYTAT